MGCGAQARNHTIIFPQHQFQDRVKVEEELKTTLATLTKQINDFENVFKELFEKMAQLNQNDQRFISTKELKQ
ncbi:hypothetical protein pb186bvf_000198 [Paramecium bursaria]